MLVKVARKCLAWSTGHRAVLNACHAAGVCVCVCVCVCVGVLRLERRPPLPDT